MRECPLSPEGFRVNQPAPPPEPESPGDTPKRRQILDGARRMFLAKGFEGASMQDVARAAGVSKGTLYVYFDNKEAMFEALVAAECGRLQQAIRSLGAGTSEVGHELRLIGLHLARVLLQDEMLAAMRMMIGAGDRFPALARQVHEAGPARSAQTLAEYLAARAARGDLRIDDCQQAAREFLDLVFAGLQRRGLLMMPPLSEAETEAHVTRRVGHFLQIYAPG